MSKKQFSFFATKDDIIKVFKVLESQVPCSFVLLDNIQKGKPYTYTSITELKDLSISIFGDINKEKSYLIIQNNISPILRKIKQHDGTTNYTIDQLSHPESVVFKPGGVLGKFECVISGQIGTISNTEWSQKVYNILFKEVKKQFTKIKSFYIGDAISKELKNGIRLTTNVKSPVEYDLEY